MESSPDARGSPEPAIKRAFTELDRLLRGEVTHIAALQPGAIDVDPGRLSLEGAPFGAKAPGFGELNRTAHVEDTNH